MTFHFSLWASKTAQWKFTFASSPAREPKLTGCQERNFSCFTGRSILASTRAAFSAPPSAAFRLALSQSAIFADAPMSGPACFLSAIPAILSFSRGFLLIHRAARAVCRSGVWNPAPGGCRRGPAFGYSGPWPVFAVSPRWQRQNKSI